MYLKSKREKDPVSQFTMKKGNPENEDSEG